jgi:hypothetical protein
VRVAVDDDGGPWEEHDVDDDAEHGRGLQIVLALSAGMGITEDGSRRMVWFRCRWNPGSPECGNQAAHPAACAPLPARQRAGGSAADTRACRVGAPRPVRRDGSWLGVSGELRVSTACAQSWLVLVSDSLTYTYARRDDRKTTCA